MEGPFRGCITKSQFQAFAHRGHGLQSQGREYRITLIVLGYRRRSRDKTVWDASKAMRVRAD